MSTLYDTHSHRSHTRRAIDSAELLIRSRLMRQRAVAFCVGFVGCLIMLWISKGVA